MVSASVHAVDHGVCRAFELVIETARDKPPDDRPRCVFTIEGKVSDAPFDPLVGESTVDALDDVAALAQRPNHGLCVLPQVPSCRTERLGEAKAFELAHAPDHGGPRVSLRRAIGCGA